MEAFAAFGSTDSPARFFYCAKANKRERGGSRHPCVKPLKLIKWLVKLVTLPGGTALEPFGGTETTGLAACLQGFNVVLIEQEEEYIADIKRRGDGDFRVHRRKDTGSVDDSHRLSRWAGKVRVRPESRIQILNRPRSLGRD